MTTPPTVRVSARLRTNAAIAHHLQTAEGSSRADIARELGYAPSTVAAAVGELIAEGRVEQFTLPEASRSAGRPPVGLRVKLTGQLLGIEFDHDQVHVAIADADGSVLTEGSLPVDTTQSATHAIAVAARLARELLSSAALGLDSVRGAAIGLPGPVDIRTGIVGSSSVLPNWLDVNVANEFRRHLGAVPVHVDNDANLAARGEVLRSANFLYVKASTGLGAAICIDGRQLRGGYGAAGELGHIAIPEEHLACRCGNRGCLETVSSSPALLRQLATFYPDATCLNDIRNIFASDPRVISRTLFDMGSQLGIHLAHLCTVLGISQVIIGGELTELGTSYIDGARETTMRWVHPQLAPHMRVVRSEIGARAGLTGALVVARQVALGGVR